MDEKKLPCPFNESHWVTPETFQRHLIRCERTYQGRRTLICPFNNTHRLDSTEIRIHIENCPERYYYDRERYDFDDGYNAYTNMERPVNTSDPLIDDDPGWEPVEPAPAFDFMENQLKIAQDKKNKHLILGLKGAIPSERKKFDEERRKQFLTHGDEEEEECGVEEFKKKDDRKPKKPEKKEEDEDDECGSEPFEHQYKYERDYRDGSDRKDRGSGTGPYFKAY